MAEFHRELALALRHAAELGGVFGDFRKRCLGEDHHEITGKGVLVHHVGTLGRQVAENGAGEPSGDGDFQLHNRFEQLRSRDHDRFLHGDPRRRFERRFGRIDGVFLAEVNFHRDVLHPEPGERALLQHFAAPLFHRRDELNRDGPADNVVDEREVHRRFVGHVPHLLEQGLVGKLLLQFLLGRDAPIEWIHPQVNFGELAATARLFPVAVVRRPALRDRFVVGDLGFFRDDVHVKSVLQAFLHGFEV